jgi:hypothetical protein
MIGHPVPMTTSLTSRDIKQFVRQLKMKDILTTTATLATTVNGYAKMCLSAELLAEIPHAGRILVLSANDMPEVQDVTYFMFTQRLPNDDWVLFPTGIIDADAHSKADSPGRILLHITTLLQLLGRRWVEEWQEMREAESL